MHQVFRIAGMILILMAGLWCVVVVIDFDRLVRVTPEIEIGSAFGTVEVLPDDEVRPIVEVANESVRTANKQGNTFGVVAAISLWVAFLAGSLVTLVAGLFGDASKQKDDAENAEGGARSHKTRWMGALGALAAIGTGLSNLAADESKAEYKCADDLTKEIRQTLSDLEAEIDPDSARQYLEELTIKATRC